MRWCKSSFVVLLCLAGLSMSCGQPAMQESASIERTYVTASPPLVTHPAVIVPAAKPVAMQVRSSSGGVYLDKSIDPTPLQSVNGSFLPRDLPAWWDWDSRVRPGTETMSTTFIAGHAQAGENLAFNPLMTSVIGDEVVLQLENNGVLVYRIESIHLIPKSEIAGSDIYAPHKGRLVLITCDVADGKDTLDNRVVIAQLV